MKRYLLLIIGLILSSPIIAQDGQSPITYESLAIQASTQNSDGDASSAITTSVSSFNGFGSYIDNPASMALSKGSFYSIGWFNQSQDQTDNYLENQHASDFSGTTFGNLGLVYKVPTERGSFVLGGGYNLVSKNSNESFLDAFNESDSITDLFKESSSDYNDIAFDAYAIDFRNEASEEIESIFRVDDRPSGFRGINQFAEISNRRTIGEISIFASTEVQKNLFVGVSLGILTGSIKYDRNFQEVDEDDLYADDVIPEDGSNPATDIYSITLTDDLDSDFYAFSARAGAIFKVLPYLSIGASIELPSKAFVTEHYTANIDTELDDFTSFLDNSFSSKFEYAITTPAEYNIGATIVDIENMSISASAEYINYSSTKVDLTLNTGDLDPSNVALLKEDEVATNEAIGRDFAAVINFKSNATYSLNNGVKLIAGYAFYPGKDKTYQFDESVYSGGISFPLTNNISADISGQYSSRNDRSLLYEFENNANQVINNSTSQTIDRLNILVGVKFKF